MSGRLSVELTGRFAYVRHRTAEISEVTALGVSLQRHHPVVCIPLSVEQAGRGRVVIRRGLETADQALVLNGVHYVCWNLAGREVQLRGAQADAWSFEATEGLPDLRALVGEPILKANCLTGPLTGSGAATRIRLPRGHLACAPQPSDCRQYRFLPAPVGKAPHTQPVCDQVVLTLPAGDVWTLELTDAAGRRPPIQVQLTPPPEGALRLHISNLCPGEDGEAEGASLPNAEFLAYYELLRTPPALEDRAVPYQVAAGKVPECYQPALLDLWQP